MKQQVLSEIKILSLYTPEDLEEVYKLESLVWSVEDAIPVNQTAAAVQNGGFVLGAFYKGQLIGFQYSFPGFNGEDVYAVSHCLGIHPDYRASGIGERLKRAQKDLALKLGYEYISWTYDPLLTVNGNLNIHKLKAVAVEYKENVYGEMCDEMNSGIATDRFLVEWRIREEADETVHSLEHPYCIKTDLANGFVKPTEIILNLNNEYLLAPVPGNFPEMKKSDFPLALKWRETTRQVFTHYLKRGWLVVDLLKDSQMENQYVYVLKWVKGNKDGD